MKSNKNFEEIIVDNDTVLLSCLTPQAFSIALGIIPIVGNLLKWRLRSVRLLQAVLFFIAENPERAEIRHKELGSYLYQSKSTDAQKDNVSQDVRRLRDDQNLSGFQAVEVFPGRFLKGRAGISEDRYLPTSYQLREFYPVLSDIQHGAIKCDLMGLPNGKRQMKLTGLINEVLRGRGYQPVERQPNARAHASPPCQDPQCTNCPIHCADALRADRAQDWRQGTYHERYIYVSDFMAQYPAGLIEEAESYEHAKHLHDKFIQTVTTYAALALEDKRRAVKRANQPKTKGGKS